MNARNNTNSISASLWALGKLALFVVAACSGTAQASTLESGWTNPPMESRVRAYWWWLNGNVTKGAITRDLEEMTAKGFGGALICDADGSSQDGNQRVPHGPTFFSPEWRELYKHALREADRLGLEMSLNIQSGWNLGGPMITADDAPKKLVWTETLLEGGSNWVVQLAQPKGRENFYRDLFVLAWPKKAAGVSDGEPIRNLLQKALLKPLQPFSAPITTPLFEDKPATPGEEDLRAAEVVDLTEKFSPDGTLRWDAPKGDWRVIRFGWTLNDHCRVSTCSEGWEGYALDPFDAGAFRRYWNAIVEPLIVDAGDFAGKTLKYLHTDSWEVEVANWTPTLRLEFEKRRGYDLLPWLPVIAGWIVNSREESNRFLHDFRRTIGDLAIANHYQLFRDGAHRHGLLLHPESGGPHAVPIDAQQCLGFNDAPMSEFWAWSWRHRMGDYNRFFVKQPASAAHTYGRKLVLAEGFTTIGPHWQETLWDNLKPSFDYACTEGLNLLVWHAFVCSPKEMGLPGQQYFAGTHLNPNVTWWQKSRPFFDYLNRCQWMLQQGRFVADVAYYYGNHVPNFAQLRASDPAKVGRGYDYDVVTEEVIVERMSVQNGRLTLPDAMSYSVLVLPPRNEISLPVLRKLRRLVAAGATVIGPRPTSAGTLTDFPACDAEVTRLADALWADEGRRVRNIPALDALKALGLDQDFKAAPLGETTPAMLDLNYIHRRDRDADVYFVASRTNVAVSALCSFRVNDKAPELWDPMTGHRLIPQTFTTEGSRSMVPLEFAPYGSWFVVFRKAAESTPHSSECNGLSFEILAEVDGPWDVSFDPIQGGPGKVTFDHLVSWTERPEPGIKHYSGTAVYSKEMVLPANAPRPGGEHRLWLDLGAVRELAEIRVNGSTCGLLWAPPFRVDVTDALQSGLNKLEIELVNFWPNRIIGDASLPKEKRLTRTNIRKLTSSTKLMESGLLGPVRWMRQEKGVERR